MACDLTLSPDGNRLYFCSEEPDSIEYTGALDIWYVNRVDTGWSNPIPLDSTINTRKSETQPSFTKEGTMYYSTGTEEPGNYKAIHYSKHINGKFTEPVKLGDSINPAYCNSGNSYVDPNESFLIYARWGIPDSIQEERGMYISFRKDDGSWTKGKKVKAETGMSGSLAALSPDGKYLFFSTKKDVYWVDSKIIDKLRMDMN